MTRLAVALALMSMTACSSPAQSHFRHDVDVEAFISDVETANRDSYRSKSRVSIVSGNGESRDALVVAEHEPGRSRITSTVQNRSVSRITIGERSWLHDGGQWREGAALLAGEIDPLLMLPQRALSVEYNGTEERGRSFTIRLRDSRPISLFTDDELRITGINAVSFVGGEELFADEVRDSFGEDFDIEAPL